MKRGGAGAGRLLWLGALTLALAGALATVIVTGYRFARERLEAPRSPAHESGPGPSGAQQTETAPGHASPLSPEASTPSPSPGLAEAPPQAQALRPVYRAADARLTPEQAMQDLWAALVRRDARAAAKYLLNEKLRVLESWEEALSELTAVSSPDLEIVKVTTAGDRAVLFATAISESFTDAQNRPLGMDAVLRLLREDGHWKLHTQRWLVNTPPGPDQKAALAWLRARPPAGKEGVTRRLDALGLLPELDQFQAAVGRNDLEQVRLFLEAGLDPDARADDAEQTPFELALLGLGGGASDDVVLVLAGAGADLDVRTPTGLTPLMMALVHCRPRVVQGLLREGARRSARDKEGRTAADWARMTCPAALPLLEPKAR